MCLAESSKTGCQLRPVPNTTKHRCVAHISQALLNQQTNQRRMKGDLAKLTARRSTPARSANDKHSRTATVLCNCQTYVFDARCLRRQDDEFASFHGPPTWRASERLRPLAPPFFFDILCRYWRWQGAFVSAGPNVEANRPGTAGRRLG